MVSYPSIYRLTECCLPGTWYTVYLVDVKGRMFMQFLFGKREIFLHKDLQVSTTSGETFNTIYNTIQKNKNYPVHLGPITTYVHIL